MALDTLLRSVDGLAGPAAYLQAARSLTAFADGLSPCRVALAGTFTLNPLVPFLQVESAREGFSADIYVAPFNSVNQELLSPQSGCSAHRPDVVFLALLLEDVCPALMTDFLTLDAVEVNQHIESVIGDLVAALQIFREHSNAAVVVHNFVLPRYPLLGVQEVTERASQTAAIRRLNERLAEAAGRLPGVYVLDCDRLAADVGYQHWQDSKMWYLARAAFSAPALRAVARAQAVFMRTVMAAPRKCLAVDLDNTLWGGVIGELGVAGIQLGHTYPGNVFREFQRTLLQLHRRGVLLAINSKNNLSDVEEVFQTHPDMVLKREHFASIHANWRPKPENMLAIARELSIGADSIVFVDDDAAECALMRQVLPEVLTLDQTPDPLARMAAVMSCAAFDKVRLTDEDRRRGELYRTQAQRDHLRNASHSVEGFLGSLDMEITIRPVDEFSLPRVVDLLQKTNQFNLTTRRYSSVELAAMLADGRHAAFSLRVTDRFGDNGIVGVALLQHAGAQARLDSFLLSCRVIGRTIETAFLAFLIDWARAHGISTLEGEFIASPKNAPAADFYARHGFTRAPGEDPVTHWTLPVLNAPVRWPAYIRQAEEMRQAS